MAIKEGWTGRVYEDFQVGDVYRHPLGRTVIDTDNVWFTLLTQNSNPIHFDRAYAAKTEFGKPLVDSTFTLALVTGQSVIDLSLNVMANLGWDEVRLPNPVFEGDTIYSQSEVLSTRESKSRPNVGDRVGEDDRFQSGRNRRHRVQAHVHGVSSWPRARASPGRAARVRYVGICPMTRRCVTRSIGLIGCTVITLACGGPDMLVDGDIAFVDVNVLPMDREQVLEEQTVIIDDGRIARSGAPTRSVLRTGSRSSRQTAAISCPV